MNQYIAKLSGNNQQTLQEHTEKLLENFEILKKYIQLDKETEKAVYLACLFHDIGKASKEFQAKIAKQKPQPKQEIPHNLLSAVIFYFLRKHFKDNIDLFRKIQYAVAYHHDRYDTDINKSKPILEDFAVRVENDLKDWILEKLKIYEITQLNIDKSKLIDGLRSALEFKKQILRNENFLKDKKTILLKGLLHRLDHAASADVEVEKGLIEDYQSIFIKGLSKKGINKLKDFQKKALDYKDKSVILTASTGMGKTEFALNWVAGDKAFYTLPVRVSVNSMYERISNIFGKDNVGILHANTTDFYLNQFKNLEDNGIEVLINQVQSVRQLSMPITVSTADQIFLATLKYSGFEKIYATLTYSKVIVDEPQGYSPDTLAVILKGLEEIYNLGGKFCLMTATMHPFIKEYLKDKAEILEPVFNPEKKHKIKLVDKTVDEMVDFAIKEYQKGKKVLILTNTVRKAQEVYKALENLKQPIQFHLLHSLYIQKTKREKEMQIQNTTEPVIWISTQIVEASLDIDYDLLITELSTADSLIQRMGRVYRKTGRTITPDNQPNIIICTKEPSGKGKVYDKEIVDYTLKELEKYDEKILTEEIKQEIVSTVFDLKRIENTNFYKKFDKNIKLLDYGFMADSKKEAQDIFRDIMNLSVIPKVIFDKNQEKINTLLEKINQKDKIERIKAMQELNDFTVSAQFYRIKNIIPYKEILISDIPYDDKLGFNLLDKDYKEIGEIL
ncbi:MAG TPA: CRISPR-associated helicase/endonuclease Cas3 [Sulfurihydrogenibium sp.]|uniref:CRISPR-associated helicase/endonuclease Cas3 n=1 Tax=Sulfurihydrogenibium sp. (strain YO3AOP1) TaxID=436114 RepID=UPI0001723939|nr:CRISPR-associated helicase/endonuclease Cas3 [Sulfurihydrogenibium sp. YO3AOP1]ACD66307.1 CRISPR-associated helicase Cas3 [Sulfurihydrogenibium sp. YO3AOP1]HBT98490.1 CRISPR-associated helicase/endonuclease Cas3 [Sulfurihydrogenibium sp.]